MKLTFSFTDESDIKALPKDNIYNTQLEFPDATLQLPDCHERILTIAHLAGQLSRAVLYLSCRELGIKNHPVKMEKEGDDSIRRSWWNTILCFERLGGHSSYRYLKIQLPVSSPLPNHDAMRNRKQRKSLQKCLIRPHDGLNRNQSEEIGTYLTTINTLSDNCLILLNAEPVIPEHMRRWQFGGFHPFWKDSALITRHNRSVKNYLAEERRRERLEQKRLTAEARAAQAIQEGKLPQSTPTTGAGRRPGAIPGIFMGVQMRSQLEIRLAAQLEEKQIRWVYEAERLGEGNYLVDFYLPDHKCWIEAKGQFEPRDNFLLREVAGYLKRERGERIFVYSQTKAYSVNSNGFREITHHELWSKIVT